MRVTTAQGAVRPPGHPPAPPPVQGGQLDGGEKGPLPGGLPAHQLVREPDSQQPPAEPQDHSNPEPPSLGPHLEHLLPRPQTALPAAAPECGGSRLVTQESVGSFAVVTISAAFWGSPGSDEELPRQ